MNENIEQSFLENNLDEADFLNSLLQDTKIPK